MLLILLTAYACVMVTVTVALVVYEILEVSADERAYERLTNWGGELMIEMEKRLEKHESAFPEEILPHLWAEIPFPLRTYTENAEKQIMLEELLPKVDLKTEESKLNENKIDEKSE